MKEIFKDVKGFEGLYKVSNKGEVKSVKRVVNHGNFNTERKLKERTIKPWDDGHGYNCVSLSKDGKVYKKKVHRLVLEAFVENEFNKPTVNHINENRKDNRLENLEWATYEENNNHGGHNKRVSLHYQNNVIQRDLEGNFIAEFHNSAEASRQTGIGVSCIRKCVNKNSKRKKAGGYLWEAK